MERRNGELWGSKPRMEIGEVAAKQIEDHYSGLGLKSVSRLVVKESIRKWNAKEEPTSLAEAAMFDIFREIDQKTTGLIP